MPIRNPPADEIFMCRDLSIKARTDVSRAMELPLTLALEYGGPSAASAVTLSVACEVIDAFVATFLVNRARERGERVRPDVVMSDDDKLFCCLFLYASMTCPDAGNISKLATNLFQKITGRTPDIPRAWAN